MEQTYQDKPVYLTQRELARRWRVTGGTIINWRKRGFLPYLKLPGSVKLLYPMQSVLDIEQKFHKPAKEVISQKNSSENKVENNKVTATLKKEWSI